MVAGPQPPLLQSAVCVVMGWSESATLPSGAPHCPQGREHVPEPSMEGCSPPSRSLPRLLLRLGCLGSRVRGPLCHPHGYDVVTGLARCSQHGASWEQGRSPYLSLRHRT